jgi:glycine hydroxymethyltransferase
MMSKILSLAKKEKERQKETLMMIPSENYTYPEVRKAVGSYLMHKYAEGYPKKRYYQGNEVVDEVESLCKKHALEAFLLSSEQWDVNVQAHSGAEANLAVYNSLLSPEDKILSMYLPHGGHLSHGWKTDEKKITLVSKIYNVNFYGVDVDSLVFDYREIERIANRFKPKLVISGGTAYPREVDHRRMSKIAKDIGAYYLADVAHEAGLIAGGAQKMDPFESADVVTMTTHKTLRGPRGALIFSKKILSEKIDAGLFPGLQGGPHMHTIAGIAIALEKTGSSEFKKYAHQTVENAKYLANLLKRLGFDIVSGGTDKHLILVDLRNKNINGWFAAWALEKAGIIVNRNTIPYDPSSPYYPSGIRLGTPAITARGMKEEEMEKIAQWINQVIEHEGERSIASDKDKRQDGLKRFKKEIDEDKFLKNIRLQVKKLCAEFPIE